MMMQQQWQEVQKCDEKKKMLEEGEGKQKKKGMMKNL